MSESLNPRQENASGVQRSASAIIPGNVSGSAAVQELRQQTSIGPGVNGRALNRKSKRRSTRPARQERQPETTDAEEPQLSEAEMLERLGQGAQYCQKIEEQLAKVAGPELDAIMRLHRMIILKLSVQAEVRPQLWDVLKDLMKPVMDWARLKEQQKEREFSEQKYREQLAAETAEAQAKKDPDATLSPETLEKIEFELKLL